MAVGETPAAPREGMRNALPNHRSHTGPQSTAAAPGAIAQAAAGQDGSRLAPHAFTDVRDLLPKGWNWAQEEEITHEPCSSRA